MWEPQIVDQFEINKINIKDIFSGKIPAIIIKGILDTEECKKLADKIKKSNSTKFQDRNLTHIGPFLMAYTTKKKEYFKKSKKSNYKLEKIFDGINPVTKIHDIIKAIYPEYSISIANEGENTHSSCVIRIHKNGKSIPIHKDNVKFEGIEYGISKIDNQLSCVLHIQESENGGDLIIYKKQWQHNDEKFRNIEFGYSQETTRNTERCRISDINSGDLVIINPNYFHEVTQIKGMTSRISLGMFLGFYENIKKVVAWA